MLEEARRPSRKGDLKILELPRPRILNWLVQEHFDELGALWERREALIFDYEWTIQDLSEHERRAASQLKGLRVGQGHSLDLARAALESDDRWAALAATLTLLNFRHPELDQEIVERLATSEGEAGEGIRIALRHSAPSAENEEALRQLIIRSEGEGRLHALDVLAFRRRPIGIDPADLRGAGEGELEGRVVEAIGRARGRWDAGACLEALESESPSTRRAALVTSIQSGVPNLAGIALDAATRNDAPVCEAIELLGVLGGENEVRVLAGALSDDALAPSALEGLAAGGVGSALPAILDAMDDPKRLHEGGQAFLRITNAPDVGPSDPVEPPEGLSEDEIDFWDEWPPVDPVRAREWWSRNQARFATGRWLAGVEVGDAPLTPAFSQLPLAGRRAAYLRARHLAPDQTPDLELEAAATSQLAIA